MLCLGLFIIVMNGRSNEVESAEQDLHGYTERLRALHVEIDKTGLSVEQRENEIERLRRANEVSRDVAEQVKNVQLTFRDHYYDDNVQVDEATLEEAKNIWYSFTGFDDFAFSWVQEPGWRIETETVSVYSSERKVPLVWSLWRADGELAGFVRGEFDIEDSTIVFDRKMTYRGEFGDPVEEDDSPDEVIPFREAFEDGIIE